MRILEALTILEDATLECKPHSTDRPEARLGARYKTKDSIVFFRGGCALPRGVDGNLGAAARRRVSFRSADGPHLPATSAATEEEIAAIGLEPRNG